MKKTILTLVGSARERAQQADRQAVAAHAAAVAGHKAWDEANPMDGVGGFSTNPYNVVSALTCLEDARKRLDHLEDTYVFAIETFLD